MKKLIILVVLIVVVWMFFVNTYQSSLGFTTPEMAQEFEKNAPKCYGWSKLLNAAEMAADAPGKSLCVGWLKK